MYFTKFAIAISTTGTATNLDYSTASANGYIYAIHYDAGTLPSTAVITVKPTDTTVMSYLAKTATADDWMVYPRTPPVTAAGAAGSTQSTILMPIVGETITVSVAGASSSEVTGTVTVYVEGNYGG